MFTLVLLILTLFFLFSFLFIIPMSIIVTNCWFEKETSREYLLLNN
jgi:hypothetical protein